jgi:hypothetical protein
VGAQAGFDPLQYDEPLGHPFEDDMVKVGFVLLGKE